MWGCGALSWTLFTPTTALTSLPPPIPFWNIQPSWHSSDDPSAPDYHNAVIHFTEWCTEICLRMNVNKTKELLFGSPSPRNPTIEKHPNSSDSAEFHIYLGITGQQTHLWSAHHRHPKSSSRFPSHWTRTSSHYPQAAGTQPWNSGGLVWGKAWSPQPWLPWRAAPLIPLPNLIIVLSSCHCCFWFDVCCFCQCELSCCGSSAIGTTKQTNRSTFFALDGNNLLLLRWELTSGCSLVKKQYVQMEKVQSSRARLTEFNLVSYDKH